MMPRVFPILFLLAAVSLNLPARAAEFQKVDSLSPPPLVLKDRHGKPYTLKPYKGHVVLVNFWASWCPPCRKEMPSMQRLKEKMAGKPFDILALDTGETVDDSSAFLKEVKVSFPVLFDPDSNTARRWKVFAMPTTFLIDKKGKIRYVLPGGTQWDEGEALALVEKLLATKL
jgi:thiol-disulfide isomerase/thioredoxin